MAELKGSKTEQNLAAAFAGESQAFQKYSYYAGAAKKAGYNKLAAYFEETARNEMAHAKLWFKNLHGGEVPTDMFLNLEAAVAKEEGFTKIAYLLEQVGKIEARHEQRYRELAAEIKDEIAFKSGEPVAWICANCDYIHVGTEAPQVCPVCAHPRAFFERFREEKPLI